MRVSLGDGYELDDDPARVDIAAVFRFLSTEAYWGRWRDLDVVRRQVAAAWRVVGLYFGADQVGFARVISDGESFGYLADVYVEPAHRSGGRGTALVREGREGAGGEGRRWMLHTRDASGLFARFGFEAPGGDVMEGPAPRGG